MNPRSPATAAILALFDAGHTPAQVVAAGYKRDLVYKVLRRERPGRPRAPRTPTSPTPALVKALTGKLRVARIASLLRITPQAVYKASRRPPQDC